MARNTYGGTVYDVAVNASNPAQLALAANGVYQLFNAAGVLQTDYKLFNTSTSAFDITATTVSVTSGFLPLFQGPDATELYDAAGRRMPHYDNLVSGSNSVTINGTTAASFTLTQDSIPDGATAKQFTPALLTAKQDAIPTYLTLTAAQTAVAAGTLADGALCVIVDPTT